MLKTNKNTRNLGDFVTRIPNKQDFTEYVYCSVDGTKTIISRSDLSPDLDDLMYEELKKEAKSNRNEIQENRAYSKDPVKHEAILDMQETKVNLEELIIGTLNNEALKIEIGKLDKDQQKLLEKKYFQNKTNTLIAAEEGVSEGTIRYKLSNIIKVLQKNLKNKI